MVESLEENRLVADVVFFVTAALMINILKGITIDTFVELRKQLEQRVRDNWLSVEPKAPHTPLDLSLAQVGRR